jgi:sterol desaturase/sphingolipid hydroxylase (fatty acid hydroxylase superfamily)
MPVIVMHKAIIINLFTSSPATPLLLLPWYVLVQLIVIPEFITVPPLHKWIKYPGDYSVSCVCVLCLCVCVCFVSVFIHSHTSFPFELG